MDNGTVGLDRVVSGHVEGTLARLVRTVVGPLLLVTLCPPTVMLLWYINTALKGSPAAFAQLVAEQGFVATLQAIWAPVFFGTPTAWAILAVFAGTQLALMRLVPGRRFLGPPSPSGHVPVYQANGFQCFAITVGLYAIGAYGLHLFSPAIAYDHFGGILGALNTFSLVFCLGLYLKGRYRPSPGDHGLSGSPIFDYYWGTELYPRVLGWDVKQFTNCRFGMMGWPILLLSYAAKQQELYGISDAMLVAVGIQLVYIAKFFWWETGYLRSLDIMHDRAGFYICWGCLVWVPGVYTASTLYLVHHPHHFGAPLALAIFALGVASVMSNYFADAQRQRVRATGGHTTVWGRPPVVIVGHYRTADGEAKENLLLASGFWGIARHFHYVPEILGAFFWTLPVLFASALPWFYPVFLTILLVHRAFRDDARCAAKYGADWDRYRERVPYKIIPGLI